MPSASAIRLQIETALAHKIPAALTPAPKSIRPVVETGIGPLDRLLEGGLPVGALTELVGAECTGRTSTALSFLSRMTQANKVCAWVDVSNSFDPSSAAAAGVDLARLLWVRCGTSERISNCSTPRFVLPQKYFAPRVAKRGLHGGGFGPHPRTEVNGLSDAIEELLQPTLTAPRCAESIPKWGPKPASFESSTRMIVGNERAPKRTKPWDSITQALRSTDLILQSGGFGAIVLDMAGLPSEIVSRIELSAWHRYRVAAERTQSSILLLSQYPCAKSSSELQLRLLSAEDLVDEATVFTGIQPRAAVSRRRFEQPVTNVVAARKPPQKEPVASWRCRTPWIGAR